MKKQGGFTLIELLIVVAIIGIIAAIAIPSLLRARVSANEAAAIGDSRTVSTAQAAYQSSNSGFHDSNLTCLSTAGKICIPGYPATAPTFLDSQIAATGGKQGYNHSHTAGVVPSVVPTNASPTSVLAFCYGSAPITQNQTGVRAFGIDASGVLCFDISGAAVCGAGTLNAGCTPVQ